MPSRSLRVARFERALSSCASSILERSDIAKVFPSRGIKERSPELTMRAHLYVIEGRTGNSRECSFNWMPSLPGDISGTQWSQVSFRRSAGVADTGVGLRIKCPLRGSNWRPSRWQSEPKVRSDAGLRFRSGTARQGAARSGIPDGPTALYGP